MPTSLSSPHCELLLQVMGRNPEDERFSLVHIDGVGVVTQVGAMVPLVTLTRFLAARDEGDSRVARRVAMARDLWDQSTTRQE